MNGDANSPALRSWRLRERSAPCTRPVIEFHPAIQDGGSNMTGTGERRERCAQAPFTTSLVLGILVFLASLAPVWAQVTAAISGHVADPSGAAVSEAMVTVKNLETGETRVVTTDAAGDFRVLS